MWLIVAPTAAATSQDLEDPRQATQAGAEALDRSGRYPWYDAEADDLRRVEVEPQQQQSAPTTSVGGNLAQTLAWTLLATLLVMIAALLIAAFLRAESRLVQTEAEEDDGRTDVDRVEALPFKVRSPQGDLLSEARRHYEQGNYGEAIIYLFSHQLVQLDRHQWIRLARGKTNRQYLGELVVGSKLQSLLEQTTLAFEDVFFGHHPLERARFESCWSQLSAFNNLLRRSPA